MDSAIRRLLQRVGTSALALVLVVSLGAGTAVSVQATSATSTGASGTSEVTSTDVAGSAPTEKAIVKPESAPTGDSASGNIGAGDSGENTDGSGSDGESDDSNPDKNGDAGNSSGKGDVSDPAGTDDEEGSQKGSDESNSKESSDTDGSKEGDSESDSDESSKEDGSSASKKDDSAATKKTDGSGASEDTDDTAASENDEEDSTSDDDDTTDVEEEIGGTTYSVWDDEEDGIMLLSDEVDDSDAVAVNSITSGVDMNGYVTSAVFYKKSGGIWVKATEFTTDDQVKGTISFSKITKADLQNNGNTIYIDLPNYIDCSRFEDQEYTAKDKGIESGKYHYEKQPDGHYRIVLVLNDDYVSTAGTYIGGSLDFEFSWDEDVIPDSGLEKVEIGNWEGGIKITKKDSGQTTSGGYELKKSAADITYTNNGKTANIEYTITLKVKQAVKGPIRLSDVLTGAGFKYADTVSVKGNGVSVAFENKKDTSTDIVLSATGDTIAKGTYYITYSVVSTVDASDASKLPSEVDNTVTLETEDKTYTADTKTKITTGSITKSGESTTEDGVTYIDYEVTLNKGTVIANLSQAAVFSDTLPSGVTLVGDVAVTQYDPNGKVTNTYKATVNDRTISYTTPTGQYYYVINYRAQVDKSQLPIGGGTITNTAKSTGGIDDEDSSNVDVSNDVLDKNYVSMTDAVQDADGHWTATITWKSRIDVAGALAGYVYEDWAEVTQDKNKNNVNPLSMTEEQFNAISITDGDGNTINSDLYTIERSTHTSSKKDSSGNAITDGLFKITFKDGATGPLTLTYTTTVNLSSFNQGKNLTFKNNASVSKDDHSDTDDASTDKFKYGTTGYIKKYGSKNTDKTSEEVDLGMYENTIPWTIAVNKDGDLLSDLTITDTIQEGMTYLPDTLTITCNKDSIKDTEGVTVTFDEDARLLKIVIKASVYIKKNNSSSYPITIGYRTQIPEENFKQSATITLSNTATLTVDDESYDSTYTQTVSQNAVYKSGVYDADEKTLTFDIVVNPNAVSLKGGSALKVTDQLKASNNNVTKLIELQSLKLFTAVKTTAEDGTTRYEPGTYIRDLEKASKIKDTDLYKYTNEDGKSPNEFVTYLPDATTFVIVAEYYVDADVTDDSAITNTVKLQGEKEWKIEDKSATITKDTSGETKTEGNHVRVIKHDRSSYNTVLSGAVFQLDKYDSTSNAWASVNASLTTDAKGVTTSQEIAFDTLYRLTETQAPDGYQVDATPTYFVAVHTTNTVTLPDSIKDDSAYSKDAVVHYTYADDTSSKTYYADIKIDRYDDKVPEVYTLPETGGTGTLPISAAGLALIITAAVMMRRRKQY